MAALTITAVRPTANTEFELVNYGATIAPGDALYRNSTDGEYLLADADLSAAAKAASAIAITPGIDGGQGIIATAGNLIFVGATMVVGTTYFLGPTAGDVVPYADLSIGDYVVRLGTARTATEIILSIEDTGVQVP